MDEISFPLLERIWRGEMTGPRPARRSMWRSLVRLDIHTATVDDTGLHGEVIGTDGPFGNLVLNVPAETFAKLGYKLGDTVPVQVGGQDLSITVCEDIQRCCGGKAAGLYRFARTVEPGNQPEKLRRDI